MQENSSINILISSEALSTSAAEDFVSDPSCGGVSLFVGKVRNSTKSKHVVRLEFESYEPMAIKELRKIAEFVQLAWAAKRVAIHHRVGVLDIGDTAVIIAVSSSHRKESMTACAYAIDTLKKTVPIWKKEVFEDGEVWVAAHP